MPDYPRDPLTLALFRKATGQTPESNPNAWDHWRTAQVTQLVREIRAAINRADPYVALTAAVGADPKLSQESYFQDTRGWLAEHLLDAVFPMNYASNVQEFERRTQIWARLRPRIPVVMGIMFDQRAAGDVLAQMQRTGPTGFSIAAFAYNSLFERRDSQGHPARDGQSASRAELRRNVIPQLRRVAAAGQRQASRSAMP